MASTKKNCLFGLKLATTMYYFLHLKIMCKKSYRLSIFILIRTQLRFMIENQNIKQFSYCLALNRTIQILLVFLTFQRVSYDPSIFESLKNMHWLTENVISVPTSRQVTGKMLIRYLLRLLIIKYI